MMLVGKDNEVTIKPASDMGSSPPARKILC
nr:MAG TPA: hypothetical protein [Caudoviricetes sp.]